MTDQELDRALASALEVEPRADFQARVRVRVAAEPPPSVWPAPWRMAAAVAAVAVIAAAVTFWSGADKEPISTVARGPIAQETLVAASAAPATLVVPATPVVPVAPPARAANRAAEPAAAVRLRPWGFGGQVVELPAPVISSDDAQLAGLLAASVRRGIVADLLSPAEGAGEALELAALDVPLLGAERPIEMNAVDAGEHQ